MHLVSKRVRYDFFAGTLFPSFLAFESPIAIACLGLVTFFPMRPDLNWPFFISLISVSTFSPAEGEYLRPEDLFAEDFFADVVFFLLVFFAEELFFLGPLDLFFAAFFVAIRILLEIQMFSRFESVV